MSIKRTLHDGVKDHLTPLATLDPDQIGDFDELLTAMGRTAFGGRCLGEALDVLEAMVIDPDCVVVGTFSGAMTVAKQSKLLIKMIDEGWLDVVVSTGALMAHGFIESIGLKHFKYEPARMNDKDLFEAGYNRVYDTLEPEANFAQAELVVREVMRQLMDVDKVTHLSSELICTAIGKHLSEKYNGPGILKSAYKKGVPVYIPAFTDSELALDVACSILAKDFGHLLGEKGPEALPFQFNPFLDLFSYSKKMFGAKKMAIFTIGGGVPRIWSQQVGPFFDVMSQRLERDLPARRFSYAIRICPEPVHWGGLSGCTYQEGISWGKFVPPAEGGQFAEVHADATLAWPLLVKGLQDRLAKKGLKAKGGRASVSKTVAPKPAAKKAAAKAKK
ncbi:MAG: deoxyhypusine synthase family protein [Humidesulfovibrio sp.]|nr:deoxyhypusine synthase family protein [Humidesulfovibrio sp.]